jgi:DNA processing protein
VGGVSADDAERRARVALTWLSEPGNAVLGEVVAAESARSVLERLAANDPAVPGLPGLTGMRLRHADLDVAALLDAVDRCGARVVVPGDPEWPASLADLGPAAPWALYVRGRPLDEVLPRSVSVVGARAATEYGRTVTADLAVDLAMRDWTVVSGGAYGIDAAAHRAALAVAGTTVAVLACPIDRAYPLAHSGLLEDVAATGSVVCEVPPGRTATRWRFLQRNRLIAALSVGTVVVEAAARSGALSTAGHAGALGRPLMAVPGPVGSQLSVGTHALIRDAGATLVTSAADVLAELGDRPSEAPSLPTPQERRPTDDLRRPTDGLNGVTLHVYEALPTRGSLAAVDLAVATGVPPAALADALRDLALRGLVAADGDRWCRSARAG